MRAEPQRAPPWSPTAPRGKTPWLPRGPGAKCGYPETQHTGLPPAPAAVPRGVAPPNTYASTAAAAHPGDAGMPPQQAETQQICRGMSNVGCIRRPVVVPPRLGQAERVIPRRPDGRNLRSLERPHGMPTAATRRKPHACYQADSWALSSQASSDFAPLNTGSAAFTGSTVIPQRYAEQPLRETPQATKRSAASEFARYDQGAYAGVDRSHNRAVHSVSVATTSIPSSYAAGPAAGVSSPAMGRRAGPSPLPPLVHITPRLPPIRCTAHETVPGGQAAQADWMAELLAGWQR